MRRRAFHQRFSQQSTQQRAIQLHHIWQVEIEHVADHLLYDRVVAPKIENTITPQKIEIRLVIHVVEIRPLSTRINFVEADDALRCHQRAVYMPLVQFVVFAQTRGDNLFKIERHEEQNLSDSCSKRKSCSHAPVARQRCCSRNAHRAVATKKAAGFRANAAAQFLRNSASLSLRLSHARRCDAQLGPCNKHELFGRLATELSQLCPSR